MQVARERKAKRGFVEGRRAVGHPSSRPMTPTRTDRKSGPGRPAIMEKSRPLTIRIGEQQYQQLRWLAFHAGHDKASIAARDIIVRFLTDNPPDKPTRRR